MRTNRKVTFRNFYECHYLPSKVDEWSENTMRHSVDCISHYLLPHFGTTLLTQIDACSLDLFMKTLSAMYSSPFVYKLMCLLRPILRMAKDMNFISKDPTRTIKLHCVANPPKSIPTQDQVSALLGAIEHRRDKCIVALVVFCQMSGAKLFGLEWGAYSGNQLKVDPRSRPLLIPAFIQEYIAEWRVLCPDASVEALMFPSHKGKEFSSSDVFMRARIIPITQRLGIPNSAMNFQALRRAAVVRSIAMPNPETALSMNCVTNRPKSIPIQDQLSALLGAIEHRRDKCIVALIAFCHLSGAKLFGLRWGAYSGDHLTVDPHSRPLSIPYFIQAYIAEWRVLCPDASAESLMFPNHKGKVFSQTYIFMRARIYPVTQLLGIPNTEMNFRALCRAAVVPGIARPNPEAALGMIFQAVNEDHVGEFSLCSAMPNNPMTAEKETMPEAMTTTEKNVSPDLNAFHSSRVEYEQVSHTGPTGDSL
jgi:integrase